MASSAAPGTRHFAIVHPKASNTLGLKQAFPVAQHKPTLHSAEKTAARRAQQVAQGGPTVL